MKRDAPSQAWIVTDAGRVRVFPIHCSGCRRRDGMPAGNHALRIPWSVYNKYWHYKGWELGKSEKADICPECLDKEKEQRRSKRSDAMLAADDVFRKIPAEQTPVMAVDAPQPDAHWGPSTQHLKALQEKFNGGEKEDEMATLRKQVAHLMREVEMLKRGR